MIDNANLNQKIAIRQKGLSLLKTNSISVLDMFAGEGILYKFIWSKVATKTTLIEKQKDKCKYEHINDNCLNHIHLCKEHNVIDLDAYGLVLPYLESVINNSNENTIVFFTESNPLVSKKDYLKSFLFTLNELKTKGVFCEKSYNSSAIYGYVIL